VIDGGTGPITTESDGKLPGSQSRQRIRVLIVDDHSVVAEGLKALFEDDPEIEVVACTGTVADAVAIAHRESPDVILMDFRLPDGTGVDATTAIRKERPRAAIVFLSVDDSDDALRLAVEAGALGYLVKSSRGHEVVDAVRRAARGEMQIPIARLKSLLLRERWQASQRAQEATRADLAGTQEALQRQSKDLATRRGHRKKNTCGDCAASSTPRSTPW
jgi:two-component system, NarL family, nitrate/nitrite response regulator NarL